MTINTALFAGVIAIGIAYFFGLWFVGHLHSRRTMSRSTHPTSRPRAASQETRVATPENSAEPAVTSTGGPAASSSGSDDTETARTSRIHAGIAELIHALGPEPDFKPGSSSLAPVATLTELPNRFTSFIAADGHLELTRLIERLLDDVGYQVSPTRGDLIATRDDERLLIRVLPWDGSFSQIGDRTVTRFVDDFRGSKAADGICVSEAAMPASAREAEAADLRVWFVGHGRLARLLESIDAALTLTRPAGRSGGEQ